ncbi:MAG: PAS domain-containing protein, partial [Nitrospiraceae bacterium]
MRTSRDEYTSSFDELVLMVAGLPPTALGVITVGILLGTFLIDLFTAPGIATWAPYPIAVITALWWGRRGAVVPVTALAILLTILAKLFSPHEVLTFGLINRTVGVMLITLVGLLCLRLDRREEALECAVQHLGTEEELLRTVVSHSTHLMALATRAGDIVALSGLMRAVSGGAQRMQVFPGWSVLEPAWALAVKGESVSGTNLTLPGDESRVWDWTLTPIRNSTGTVTQVLFEAQDVTRRVRDS